MKWIKVLSINILLLFTLVGVLFLVPPVAQLLHKPLNEDARSKLKIYSDIRWAGSHFAELQELTTTYYDYVTWRRDDYVGETINIIDGIRVSSNIPRDNIKASRFFFFGGSTTWGTGVNDENTYPSIFAKLTGNDVTNFGETNYIARQSLGYLNNHVISNSLLDMTDTHVIFYDGVNDVAARCRSEVYGLASDRESQIQNRLYSRYSFRRTFAQLHEFMNMVLSKITHSELSDKSNKLYNCASQQQRALEVAQTLIDTWEVASNLVENRGGKFTAILQPVAYYGNADTSYLKLTSNIDRALAAQYEAVYPLIIKLATGRDFKFVDLTSVYDGCNDCYIDYCHVGPQTHQILVSSLAQFLNE